MLDYILSKMVLMIFLLLLLGVFASLGGALDSFFIQNSAKSVVTGITERVRALMGSVASSYRSTAYVLPAYLEGQEKKIGYEVTFACTRKAGKTYIAFAVRDLRGTVLAYDGFALSSPEGPVTVKYCGFPAVSAGKNAKRYIVMERKIFPGKVEVTLCASDTGSCSCKPEVC